MKIFVCIALAFNCVLAAHLGNTYIPPPSHASTAGGSTFLQTPSHGGGGAFGSQFASSNQFSSTSGNGAGAHFGFSGQQQQQQNHHQQQQGSYQQGGQTQNYHQNNQYQHQQQSSGQQIPIIRFENQPNAGDGSFSYSYETGNGIQANAQGQLKQIGGAAGIAIQGAFSYPGDDGQNYALTYTADENGYRPVGAHLPTPPPIPEEIQKSLELIARNPPQGAENGAYIHSNEGSYNHQSGAGGYGQQQQQGSYQQGGHHQSSFSGHTSGFGGQQQQQHNFGGQHGSFGAASTATSQQYLPPKNQQQGFSGYKY